ncbi:DUF4065 domain-containing protein [Fructobacillus sp. M2-14]|uniref:DUF4065 domain-containing protein n=1 Tax=Fructobacillus broussonetiae TaxID=2713173 RepID=A0ABS5R1R9_9LACO|nr:type II toxin-antitoxin system antitoxin SocA domain-containing protein [Fructobacillus broussonetiae]MBS9338972.1 DUF4065 domain-containing protein [Fructobacillus broussonetiae]
MKTWSALQVVDWMRLHSFAELKCNPNAEELTQMKAMKLLYYAQGLALAVFGEPLFKENLLAYRYGPVVETVHERYKHYRGIVHITMPDGFVVNEENGIDPDALENYTAIFEDPESNSVLRNVMKLYGEESATELMERTHEERPWKETEQSGVIDLELIKQYFTDEVVEKDV